MATTATAIGKYSAYATLVLGNGATETVNHSVGGTAAEQRITIEPTDANGALAYISARTDNSFDVKNAAGGAQANVKVIISRIHSIQR